MTTLTSRILTASLRDRAAAALTVAIMLALALALPGTASAQLAGFNPGVDYTKPNFANSPNLRKFMDSLPGLGAANANNLGQYIPIANPDTTTYPGSDYYELGLMNYNQRMHTDLPAAGTRLRGYYQMNLGTSGTTDNSQHYLGPLIIAQRDKPVRLLFRNELPVGMAGDLPLPVDTTIMGAGMGPLGGMEMYTQNRSTIHLHGGFTPWISDGTPHQWITPAGDPTSYKKGVSFQNVPDMVGPGKSIPAPSAGDGLATYYYPNQQSARLMFYHDHAYGITRLNVYAGVAAGYLITDQVEEDLIAGTNLSGGNPAKAKILPDLGGVYHYGIPLIIQDRTYVKDAATPTPASFPTGTYTSTPATLAVDPLWRWSSGGDFWFPHEYMPNEDIYSPLGYNPQGRWDYAPWMIPPMIPLNNTLPSPTLIPEAFGDTMIVNGAAFPYLPVPTSPVRFRILNACNDRMLNLQLYYAATAAGVVCRGNAVADQTLCTEVSMVPAVPNAAYPAWPRDGRDGGVPDPTTAGPDIIQIGNEGGFLVKPAILKQQPIDFDYNRRSVTFGGVTSKTLLLPPAVRADIIVDLSLVPAGSTLMVYNDAPAPMPLFDTRNDYFTNDPDQTAAGGAPTTPPGFGPNTRTVMQLRVDPAGVAGLPYDVTALQAALPKAFAADQEPPLVPASAYNAAYGTAYTDIYARSVDESLNVSGTTQSLQKVVMELPGQGYTTPPTVVFSGGGGTGAAAVASLNGVTGITLVTAGTGYTAPPTVTIGAPGAGGIQATAVASITGGAVTVITITNPGSNYTVAPLVTFTGGNGTGATAVSTITLGSVGAITLTNPGSGYTAAPQVFLQGGGGTGATAAALLNGSLVLNGKNLVEGFDMMFGRMNAVLGSTPNILAPTVGAGPVIGAAFYVDPPTEILNSGETSLWRITHIGVDSHSIHFHLFDVQVINRVDWTNTIKPPYDDEFGWKETIRTNPFEDIIVALRPKAMNLPFAIPDSNRLLDPTTPVGSTMNFLPVPPPPGLPAVAQITNVMTNFGWEYVWHCHLLGHEENDMMRPVVFRPTAASVGVAPTSLAFGVQPVNTATASQTVTITNTSAAGSQSLVINNIAAGGTNPADFILPINTCGASIAPGANCMINVAFMPTAGGTRTATLAISTNDPARPTLNVSLSGTGLVPPTAPSTLTAAIGTVSSINLSWRDNSTTETSFVVYGSVNGGAFTQIGTVPRTGTATTGTGGTVTFTQTGLTVGNTYAYYITALNAAGASAATVTVTVSFTVPAGATGLSATAVSSTRVNLAWTDNSSNETGFRIERAVGGGGFVTIASVGANVTTYSDITATAATTYSYRVFALNLLGNGTASNTATATTPAATPPLGPSSLRASTLTSTYVVLSWTDNSTNESGFYVERSTNAGATWTRIGQTGANSTLFRNSYLTTGTTYSYRVQAFNSGGVSGYSNILTVTTP